MLTPKITRNGSHINPARAIMLTPNAHITRKAIMGNEGSKNQAKFTTVNSRNISHKPLVSKNLDNAFLPFRCPTRKAEVPDRNINAGAQKWVIHRVKNSDAFVCVRSVGLYKNASV